jgi:large subunit ribosomal protein L25
MELTVECQKRPEGSKPRALRRAGLIPAVLYGHNKTESISLTVNAKTVDILLRKVSVNNTIIDLKVTDLPWSGKTLLREVQSHPWKGFPYHLSFFAVAAHGDLDVEVPLHFLGEAVGVKLEGGILDPVMTALQVRCAADKIPDAIEVNVSELHVGGSLHISEIVFPAGVTALSEPGQLVVSVLGAQKGVTEAEADSEATQA